MPVFQALIMHVISMSPEQLNTLPPEQRNTYMQIVSWLLTFIIGLVSMLNIFVAGYPRHLIDWMYPYVLLIDLIHIFKKSLGGYPRYIIMVHLKDKDTARQRECFENKKKGNRTAVLGHIPCF
jgi:hypothetical protein